MRQTNDISYVERFAQTDLMSLHSRLTDTSVDSFQAAQIVADFLSGRGYGVSQCDARVAVGRIDNARFSVERIQAELERVARVM